MSADLVASRAGESLLYSNNGVAVVVALDGYRTGPLTLLESALARGYWDQGGKDNRLARTVAEEALGDATVATITGVKSALI
jgi:hypothetical protein